MGDKYPQIFDDDKEHWRAICNSRSIYEVLYFYFNLYIITEQFLWRYLLQKFFPLNIRVCLLYTSPSPRDGLLSRMPSSA